MKEEENLASAAVRDARFTTVISDHKVFITVVELAPLFFLAFTTSTVCPQQQIQTQIDR